MSTCVAPGHPSCRITCPKGCGAYWSAKQGCVTRCYNVADSPVLIGEDEVFSVQVSELPSDGLMKMFGDILSSEMEKTASSSNKTVSFSLTDATKKDLIEAVQKQLS
jgi:hypothetical protein